MRCCSSDTRRRLLVSDADNTWEGQADIHPDLIAEFDRQQAANEPSSSIYSTHGDEPPPPKKSRASLSTTSSSNNNDSPPAKKKKKTSSSVVLTSTATTASPPPPPPPSHLPPAAPAPAPTSEAPRKVFGVEKGWRVRAVIGAAKQRDSSVLYAVDYMQGSPTLREYVPSEIAHIHIPRELIEFFQRKIVWNSPKDTA